MATLPTQARIVVVGGGIVGCSTAYHLAKLGHADVLRLDRRVRACGPPERCGRASPKCA